MEPRDPVHAEPSDPVGGSSEVQRYLFAEISIVPPAEEFRRLCEKKLRSFEGGEGSSLADAYQRAFALGEQLIARRISAKTHEEGEGC